MLKLQISDERGDGKDLSDFSRTGVIDEYRAKCSKFYFQAQLEPRAWQPESKVGERALLAKVFGF